MPSRTERWIILLLRVVVGAVFIYAAFSKILNPSAFANDIDNYRMLPYLLVSLMAIVLPWLELLCGFLLVFGKWLRGSSFIIIAMNIVFIIAIGSAIARGLDITCGCFSAAGEGTKVGVSRLVQDILLLGAGVMIYWRTGSDD